MDLLLLLRIIAVATVAFVALAVRCHRAYENRRLSDGGRNLIRNE